MTTSNGRPRSRIREKRAEELKRQILDAAIGILATEGLSESTTAEISRRAEVSESSIFWHFGSREGLLQAVAVELLNRVGAAVQDVVDERRSLRERVVALIDREVEIMRTQQHALRAVSILLNENKLMANVRPTLADLLRERRRPVQTLIREAIAAGEITAISPTVLIEFLSGASIGMHAHLRHHRAGYDPEPMYRALRTAGLALVGLDENGNPLAKSPSSAS